MAELVVTQDVNAPAERVWSRSSTGTCTTSWMLLTRASGGARRSASRSRRSPASGGSASSTTMTITGLGAAAPRVVRHTGRVVRGTGAFEVREPRPQRSHASSGRSGSTCRSASLGRAGWPLVRPLLRAGVSFSLRRLARYVEAGRVTRRSSSAPTAWPAARGGRARPTTCPTTTTSGAGRCTATPRCSSGSASRRSSPGCPGSRSCASGRRSGRRSPASTRRVAAFDDADVERLLADAGIVRNRAKVAGDDRQRARRARPSTDVSTTLLWSFAPDRRRPAPRGLGDVPAVTDESTAMAKELKRRGFRFVGPTTAYALMQATGMVNDHLAGCAFRDAHADAARRQRPSNGSVSPWPGTTSRRRDGRRSSR